MIILAAIVSVVISVAISYFIMVEAVKRCIDFAGDLAEQSNDFTYDVMKSHIDKWHKGD